MADEEPSYLDYETFLDPSFSATSFANTLVVATNDPNDSPLDLTTPLSRVLFDVQEVDTHIDNLTSQSALPLLHYTKDSVDASTRILRELESQVAILTGSYERLEREIIAKHEAADEVRLVTERLWQTLKLARSVGRCLTLGRQLEGQMTDFRGGDSGRREDVRAMVRVANTTVLMRQIFEAKHQGGEGEGLERITIIRSLRAELVDASENTVLTRAEQIVAQFSMSSLTAGDSDGPTSGATTYAQTEDMRSRATSALTTLYLLSPVSQATTKGAFEPTLLLSTLQEYLKRAITSSLAGMTAGLSTLPKLERNLLEVSARCQNIVALELLLESIKPPPHPLLSANPESAEFQDPQASSSAPSNLLQPLLASLDTPSLASYFWRSMASQLSSRVQKILREGGVSARTLRSNKERVRDAIRECVNRGSQLPVSSLTRARGTVVGNWEREAAVMVGSVVNVMGR